MGGRDSGFGFFLELAEVTLFFRQLLSERIFRLTTELGKSLGGLLGRHFWCVIHGFQN